MIKVELIPGNRSILIELSNYVGGYSTMFDYNVETRSEFIHDLEYNRGIIADIQQMVFYLPNDLYFRLILGFIK